MTKKIEDEWKSLTLYETLRKMKKSFSKDFLRLDQEETINEIQWLLQWHGWYLLCRMEKEFPYPVKYRLVGYKEYEKDKPKIFIQEAPKFLLHYRKK